MRYLLAACFSVLAWLCAPVVLGAQPALEIQILDLSVDPPDPAALTSGALDAKFLPAEPGGPRLDVREFWLRVRSPLDFAPAGLPTLNVRKARHLQVEAFTAGIQDSAGAAAGLESEPRHDTGVACGVRIAKESRGFER